MQHEKTGERIRLALETPFIIRVISDLSILPDDEVVFQLGDDQICLFARKSKKLGLLTRGRSPIAVTRPQDTKAIGSSLSRLLKNSLYVTARSVFCDAAISK
jgi:hypothetical protein